MATVFLEGFDKYGPPTPNSPTFITTMQSEYNVVANANQITTSLNGQGGYAFITPANTGGLRKTFSTAYGRLIGGMRFKTPLAPGLCPFWTFHNNSSNMCTIYVNGGGQFAFLTGANSSGTLINISSTYITGLSIHYLEWDITFGASSSYAFYLDGAAFMSGTGNTGNGQTTANEITIGADGSTNTSDMTLDDFYLFDNTGSFNNAVLLTNPRIETRYPTSDSQTQWTNNGNVLVPSGVVQTGVSSITSTTGAPGGSALLAKLVLMKVIPGANCTLQSVAFQPAGSSTTAKHKSVLYTDSAGAPNTLVATGTEVIGVLSGTVETLPFGSGQSLTGGTSYWIGYITDSTVSLNFYDNTTSVGVSATNTYGSGAPATAPAMTAGSSWEMWGNATGATVDWVSVNQNPPSGVGPAGDNGTIKSSTSGNEDLYGFPALSGTATTVYAVAVKANVRMTDVGNRTLDLRLKSSGSDSAGSTAGQIPGSTYGWQSSYFDSNPNGSIAWTPTTANAATAGPKVAS